ncbi:cupin domain-containing protein [Candidatus Parcubacteria bacterium]|nr:MAG: cupin domain-containing protein [Candidatus Parcubacteria bacterium]
MKIKKIAPQSNLDTVRDGRGGIFTFYPDKPILEFNFQFLNKGKIRGNHYHPEYDEYYLITDGNGVMVTKTDDGKDEFLYVGKGDCLFIPQGVSHVFYAITDCNLVTFLTKKWDDCDPPIVHENLGMGTGDHGDPNYKPPVLE